jgi:DNA segregation ATPase FtsK/SpoIIIE, S-DNA-T family
MQWLTRRSSRFATTRVGVRIALQSTEEVSRQLLGDDNPAAAQLQHAGDAVFNASGGVRSANEPIRIAFLAADVRSRLIQGVASQFGARSPVVFEGKTPADLCTSRYFAMARPPMSMAEGQALLGEPSQLDAFVVADLGC